MVGDVRLHVQAMGAGQPVVMLHGLLVGNLASWFFTTAPALAASHAVTLYDLRGHGRSDRPCGGYGVDSMVRDLYGLVDSQIGEPVSLVGHSYGALIALHYAMAYPERVRRLVLVEAPLPPSEVLEMNRLLAAETQELLGALPPPLSEAVRSGGRQARRFIDGLRFLVETSSLLSDLEAEADVSDSRLADLDVPTRCIYGKTSSCRASGERLAKVIPNGELRLIPGGHFLPTESPGALTAEILEFFHA